ncbi:MAG: GntR family transcriptional regulator [Betaproteobacteria bacterium]|nr:MAG: GntR family transcriptional regulator [Betaproteobacteria bacterium]
MQPTDFLHRYGKPGVPGLPKYAQLRETLVSAIRAGHWKPGDKLPAESELTRLTSFSLGTVQRALRELADEGIVVRSQGSGTYVAEGRAPIDAPLHLRFLGREGEPRFLPLFPKVLGRKRIEERGPWSEWLGQRGANIIRIDRKLSVNGEFTVFNRFYVNTDTFPEIAERPLAALDGVNLKQLLGAAFNMPITDVEQRISFVKLPPEACTATGVKPGTRGMLLESAASAGRGYPIYFLELFIPPNERQLDVSST